MASADNLTDTEQQLLMAALVLGLGPATDLSTASTVRIVNQVLRWRGLTPEQVAGGWREEDCDPAHEEVYDALVRMTQPLYRGEPSRPPERPCVALFEGRGNWGVPGDPERPACWPHFNSCRLTSEGERQARELLERRPGHFPPG